MYCNLYKCPPWANHTPILTEHEQGTGLLTALGVKILVCSWREAMSCPARHWECPRVHGLRSHVFWLWLIEEHVDVAYRAHKPLSQGHLKSATAWVQTWLRPPYILLGVSLKQGLLKYFEVEPDTREAYRLEFTRRIQNVTVLGSIETTRLTVAQHLGGLPRGWNKMWWAEQEFTSSREEESQLSRESKDSKASMRHKVSTLRSCS